MLSQKVNLLNEEINYVFEDTGKPKVLFLHGFNSSWKFANSIYKSEQRKFDFIAFDFPGCGLSTANNAISIEFYQQIALAFVEHFNLKDFYIVSHSLGAASAMYLNQKASVAYTFLGAPINYYLVDENIGQDPEKLKKWLLPTTMEDAVESTTNLVGNKNDLYIKNIDNTSKYLLNSVKRVGPLFQNMVDNEITNDHYLKNNLQKVYELNQNNIVFLSGDNDYFVKLNTIEKISQEKNWQNYVFTNCGHTVFYEYPEKVLEIINKLF